MHHIHFHHCKLCTKRSPLHDVPAKTKQSKSTWWNYFPHRLQVVKFAIFLSSVVLASDFCLTPNEEFLTESLWEQITFIYDRPS